jgi:uncharacterized NAD(P)/FAD-binding protein YdhS
MKKIAIIGCGFSGTMTAIHLIKNVTTPVELVMIGDQAGFNKGIAYNPNSKQQILNVVASRMSAFPGDPDHFLNWALQLDQYAGTDRGLLANAYLPRYLYGKYLEGIWKETMVSPGSAKTQVMIKDAFVVDMDVTAHEVVLGLDNGERLVVQYCIIASGNHPPGNPDIPNRQFFNSPVYFRNPWELSTLQDIDPNLPVLIIGNGLTMADTVLGLIEHGFKNKIHTVSPHGFCMLPHTHLGISYNAITEELSGKHHLIDLVRIINKHIRHARKLGFTAEPVIDAIRPLTQALWQNLSTGEKKLFMSRLRHLWDSVRHRIPMHIREKLLQLSAEGTLNLHTGKLIDITEAGAGISVIYADAESKEVKMIRVSAVINCSGPATNLEKTDVNYLVKAARIGIIRQDELRLGILADPSSFEVYDSSFVLQKNLFTLGSMLKGVVWETTAVKELREQALSLATQLAAKLQ